MLEHHLGQRDRGEKGAITDTLLARLWRDTGRRLAGEPLQYILGEWEFFSLPFEVGPGVLIPRPDTECLVECALDWLRSRPRARVLDLCSGSGAIAVAVAKNAKDCRMTAIEWSPDALEYLHRNLALNDLQQVRTVCADALAGPQGEGPFDLILSNPPYIRSEDIQRLDREVLREPRCALDGGGDGLLFYRAIVSLWTAALSQDGAVMVEIGFDQADDVSRLFAEQFSHVECVQDYGGRDRVMIGTHTA